MLQDQRVADNQRRAAVGQELRQAGQLRGPEVLERELAERGQQREQRPKLGHAHLLQNRDRVGRFRSAYPHQEPRVVRLLQKGHCAEQSPEFKALKASSQVRPGRCRR